MPSSPQILSSPAPPTMESSPAPPEMTSLPGVPVSWSLPSVPWMVTLAPAQSVCWGTADPLATPASSQHATPAAANRAGRFN